MRSLLHVVKFTLSLRAPLRNQTAILRFAIGAGMLLVLCAPARADNSVSVNSQGLPIAFVNTSLSMGWRFTCNVPIQVTSLGLLDANNDGFQTDHPVGLWNGDGELLAEVLIHQGAVEPLVDRFRYAALATPDQPILLPGEEYTIGFYDTPASPNDGFVVWNGTYTMNPAITQVGASFYAFTNGLSMPETPDSVGAQCFGPGFQFNVVPGPGALPLVIMSMTIARRRRR